MSISIKSITDIHHLSINSISELRYKNEIVIDGRKYSFENITSYPSGNLCINNVTYVSNESRNFILRFFNNIKHFFLGTDNNLKHALNNKFKDFITFTEKTRSVNDLRREISSQLHVLEDSHIHKRMREALDSVDKLVNKIVDCLVEIRDPTKAIKYYKLLDNEVVAQYSVILETIDCAKCFNRMIDSPNKKAGTGYPNLSPDVESTYYRMLAVCKDNFTVVTEELSRNLSAKSWDDCQAIINGPLSFIKNATEQQPMILLNTQPLVKEEYLHYPVIANLIAELKIAKDDLTNILTTRELQYAPSMNNQMRLCASLFAEITSCLKQVDKINDLSAEFRILNKSIADNACLNKMQVNFEKQHIVHTTVLKDVAEQRRLNTIFAFCQKSQAFFEQMNDVLSDKMLTPSDLKKIVDDWSGPLSKQISTYTDQIRAFISKAEAKNSLTKSLDADLRTEAEVALDYRIKNEVNPEFRDKLETYRSHLRRVEIEPYCTPEQEEIYIANCMADLHEITENQSDEIKLLMRDVEEIISAVQEVKDTVTKIFNMQQENSKRIIHTLGLLQEAKINLYEANVELEKALSDFNKTPVIFRRKAVLDEIIKLQQKIKEAYNQKDEEEKKLMQEMKI